MVACQRGGGCNGPRGRGADSVESSRCCEMEINWAEQINDEGRRLGLGAKTGWRL